MSFLKKLFGLGGTAGTQATEPDVAASQDHNGFTIKATPFKAANGYQVSGIIVRETNGVVKETRFIRADAFASKEDAVSVSFLKARQIIDQSGATFLT